VQRGETNYDDLTPELAAIVRGQPGAREAAAHLGPVESVLFKGVGARGADIWCTARRVPARQRLEV
jgi:hypothetical protein